MSVNGDTKPQRRRGRIQTEEWGQMWALLREGQSAEEIALALNRPVRTIRKCLREGDPKRGIRPPLERLAELARVAEDIADLNDAKLLAKGLKVWDRMFDGGTEKLAARVLSGDVEITVNDALKISKERRETLKDLRAVGGRPTEVVEHHVMPAPQRNTPETIRALQGLSDSERRALTRLAAHNPEMFDDDEEDGGDE